YDTVPNRSRLADEIIPQLRQALRAHKAHEWETIFADQVPCAAVRPMEEMFDHPQVQAEQLVTAMEHPVAGRYRGVKGPLRFSETPAPEPFAAPALGQHTKQIIQG